MKCPNCVLGDLRFCIRGELRFQTDELGRPCGTADVRSQEDRFWMTCDTCNAGFGVGGWQADGAGRVILTEFEPHPDNDEVEFEPKNPPPSAAQFD